MARPLLGVDLPAVRDRHSWDSRWHGAAWAGLVLVVGAVAAVVLLGGVPLGVSLVVDGFDRGVQLWWRVPLGVCLVLGSFAIQAVFGSILVRAAPRVLGPTSADRLALAAEREQELARSNELARELHDTIGHSLTAISVQAEAGRIVGSQDADSAQRAFEKISTVANAALAELDAVLGDLRGGGRGRTLEDLRALVECAPTDAPSGLEVSGRWARLDEHISAQLYRIAQEGLTNAAKHGKGGAQVRVDIAAQVTLKVTNMIDRQRDRSTRTGHGIIGLTERAAVTGGSVEAGPTQDGKEWVLCARLPIR
nr:histidine kinase [Flexivirga oryzae]